MQKIRQLAHWFGFTIGKAAQYDQNYIKSKEFQIKAKEKIELEVSDGGLVNIIHNGKDLGNPGDLGKSKKVKYP